MVFTARALNNFFNLFFVCSKNQWRSPTAELLFKDHPLHRARSAGTSEKARIKINEKMISWANVIFVMERKHQQLLKQKYPGAIAGKNIVVLDIADDYQFGDEELIGILKTSLQDYL